MSRHESTDNGAAPIVDAELVDDLEDPVVAEETVEGLPVLAEVRAIQRALAGLAAAPSRPPRSPPRGSSPAPPRWRWCAVTARASSPAAAGPRRALDALPIVGSRTSWSTST